MSLIRLHNVTKQYDDTLVLREVYFRLSEGERAGLIGKNGTGKTTALKLILGQEQPTQGTVDVDAGVRIATFHSSQSSAARRPSWRCWTASLPTSTPSKRSC